jgi:hypothetical protein
MVVPALTAAGSLSQAVSQATSRVLPMPSSLGPTGPTAPGTPVRTWQAPQVFEPKRSAPFRPGAAATYSAAGASLVLAAPAAAGAAGAETPSFR